jgi:hypothetical protein
MARYNIRFKDRRKYQMDQSNLYIYNLILLVTQNLIGSFDFSEVFLILYTITWRDVTMQSSFLASTILHRVMQNLPSLSRYSSNLVKHYSINKIISNEVNFDVLYTIYCNLGQFTLLYNPRSVNCPKFSCEIVALRENFIDRPESYNSFSAKSCVFLAHGLGVYFSIPLHNLAQSKVSKIPKTFTYYSRTITNLAHEKTRTVWGIFLHSHTQSDPKQGIKQFLRHFPTALVPSLILQIFDIIQSSLESYTREFFAYH